VSGSPGYEESGPFLARLAIYEWQRDPVDLPGLVVAALEGATGVVLDVGCGPGRYAQRLLTDRPDLRVATLDLSPGMRPQVVGDAARLPFPAASAGAALAMHMLYHVPDIPAAVAELRRVVRPGGVVLVSTNRPDNMPELGDLVTDALDALGGRERFVSPSSRFSAADGDLLTAAFDDVDLAVFDRAVVVPLVDPVVAYVDSMRAYYRPLLPPGVSWERFMTEVREHVVRVVERAGSFRLSTGLALFVCR
jgi:SAM-dependent methyltransferase